MLCVVFESLEDLYSSHRDIPLQSESKLYKVFYRNQKSLVHRSQSAERFWQQDLCELSCILCADDTFQRRSLSLSYAQFPLEQSLSCSPSNFARCHLRNTLNSIYQCNELNETTPVTMQGTSGGAVAPRSSTETKSVMQ